MAGDMERLRVLAREGDQEAARLLLTEAKRRGDRRGAEEALRALGGAPLSEFLARAPLSESEITALFLPLAIYLEALHRAGEIHGDLSPDKVWLSEMRQGGVRELVGLSPPEVLVTYQGPLWRSGDHYIAPERNPDTVVGASSPPLTASADVYSVAMMLMTATTLNTPIYAGPAKRAWLEWIADAQDTNPTRRPSLLALLNLMEPMPVESAAITLYGMAPVEVMAPAYGLPPQRQMQPPSAPGEGGVMRRLWRRLFGG